MTISTLSFGASAYASQHQYKFDMGGINTGKGTSDYIKKWYTSCKSGEVNSIYLPGHRFPDNDPDIQISCPGKLS